MPTEQNKLMTHSQALWVVQSLTFSMCPRLSGSSPKPGNPSHRILRKRQVEIRKGHAYSAPTFSDPRGGGGRVKVMKWMPGLSSQADFPIFGLPISPPLSPFPQGKWEGSCSGNSIETATFLPPRRIINLRGATSLTTQPHFLLAGCSWGAKYGRGEFAARFIAQAF